MTKKDLLKLLQHETYVRLKESKIHGVGVFAIKDIPKGVNPFAGVAQDEWIGFTKKELSSLEPSVRKLMDDFLSVQKGKVWVPANGLGSINMSFYMNETRRPNVMAVNQGDFFKTTRLIKAGEELTVDYSTFSEED